MALTVNIPGTATATVGEDDYIRVSLQVEIKDGVDIYDSKTLSITVFRHTDQVLQRSVALMVAEIMQYKALCQKQKAIQTVMATFTDLVKAAV